MQFSRLVTPPRPLCRRWWTSQAAAGWWQPPAHWQNLSRSLTALRIAAGTSSLYPTSKGRLGPARRAPSCSRRRKLASPPGPEARGTALPLMGRSRGPPVRPGRGVGPPRASEGLAAEPGRGGQQDLKGLRGTGVQGSRVGGGRVRGGRSGVTGVAGSGGVKGGGGVGGVGPAVAVAVPG